MFCPIKHLSPKSSPTDQCNPNCAWAIRQGEECICAFTVIAVKGLDTPVSYNVGKLKDHHGRT